ncbi:RNA pseudouridine synthase [Treponema sp. TIM-1]|uniref:RluA family pseudouridine synthase n=1 Tax=Treponema sp. TIM-1 TaxID=2898417 RepID=UPI00397EA7E3
MKNISLLFENDECIILNKPAGLPVQGGEKVGASLDRILASERSPRPLLVHRLDKDTSGLILVAKNREAAARFSVLFSSGGTNRGITKLYLAICAGQPNPPSGIIREELSGKRGIQKAVTSYRLLDENGGFSLMELKLGTGRTHQIRRHLSRLGNPILGDDKYGNFALNKELRKTLGLKYLLLHSARLIIDASLLGYPLDVSTPPPDYFQIFNIGEGPGYEPVHLPKRKESL